jgi:hypothetical protein
LEDSFNHFFQALLVPVELVTNRAGWAGQPLQGAVPDAISIKKIILKNREPASNKKKKKI